MKKKPVWFVRFTFHPPNRELAEKYQHAYIDLGAIKTEIYEQIIDIAGTGRKQIVVYGTFVYPLGFDEVRKRVRLFR